MFSEKYDKLFALTFSAEATYMHVLFEGRRPRHRGEILSSNSGCTLRVQVYLPPERLGFHQLWSDKQQNLPSAHQLCRMLAPFSTSSASLTPCPLPLPIQKGVQMQGIGSNTVNLSLRALNSMPGTKGSWVWWRYPRVCGDSR